MTLFKTVFVLISVAALALPDTALAQVYRVEDDQGEVTYTDSPAEGSRAQSVELPPLNTQPGLPVRQQSKPAAAEPGQGYTTAYILQPENDSTVPPGQLDIVVQVALEPTLQTGHLLQLYFDGQPYGEPVAGTAFSIGDLTRGSHSIHAKVLNADGEVLTTVDPVVVFVHRAAVGAAQSASSGGN